MSALPDGRAKAMNRRAATASAITIPTQNQITSHRGASPTLIVEGDSICRLPFSGLDLSVFSSADADSSLVFVVFISTMSFFKGDLCWGPRYLTPILALLWLFAPSAAAAWPRRLTVGLLCLGFLVQLLGLSVDPLRLYVHHRLPSGYFGGQEWIHFEPAVGHLVNRPREILEICRDDGAQTTAFCADPRPTSTTLLLENFDNGPEAVRKYRYLASFRPWWISQRWLSPPERPVALLPTAAMLLALAGAGLGLSVLGLRGRLFATT